MNQVFRPAKERALQRTCAATLHHLVVALLIRGNEDDLGAKAVPRLLEEFHRIGPSSPLLGVPQNHALGWDVVVDKARYCRPECLLLVGAYPDEEPMVESSVRKRGEAKGKERKERKKKGPSRMTYQFGLWMQVDRAAPIPVPVQMRMPRLNMADACPTPAISVSVDFPFGQDGTTLSAYRT